MNKLLFSSLIIFVLSLSQNKTLNAAQNFQSVTDSIPSMVKGNFTDDYGIRYTISDSLWTQHPNAKYHIIKWNTKDQYLIARNDSKNPSEAGLYTRIDYMSFTNMEPFLWGFCLTIYNAPNDAAAEATAAADRVNPRKGCGGYPFSRMKRVD